MQKLRKDSVPLFCASLCRFSKIFCNFLPVFSFLYSLLRKLYYRIFIIVLYNLGKCSFLRNKLSSNLTKVAIGFEVCQLAQVDGSYIEGNPLCISKYLHYMKKKHLPHYLKQQRTQNKAKEGVEHFTPLHVKKIHLLYFPLHGKFTSFFQAQ